MLKYAAIYGIILMISDCNKYDDTQAAAILQVPAYTQTGANTMGCYINGKVWANFGETFVKPAEDFLGGGKLYPNLVQANFESISFNGDSVFAVSGKYTLSKTGTIENESALSLFIPKNGSFLGTHRLTDTNLTGCFYAGIKPIFDYRSLPANPFTVIIKKDSITPTGRHIVSGTFSGTVYRTYPADSLKITDGVFDAGF